MSTDPGNPRKDVQLRGTVIEYYCGSHIQQPKDGYRGPRAAAAYRCCLGVLKNAFLPEGFPESVTSDYVGFQIWDTVQALSSYVRGMLSSQAILKGVGVGQQAATPLGAVFQFFIRDLLGMLGGIIFTYIEGSNFDSCAKQWRLFADVTNDMGMAVELASPFFPSAFLLMACFGSMARSLTGVAGGATRAALTMHFAKQGNAADIAAKEQSQEVATTMVGMVLGMFVTRMAADHFLWSWAIFIVLTYVHIHANILAMRCLVLKSLNQPRLDHIIATYLKQGRMTTPILMADVEELTPPPYRYILQLFGWKKPVNVVFGARASILMALRPDLWSQGAVFPALLSQQEQPVSKPVNFRDAWKQPDPSPYVVGCAGGKVLVVLRKGSSPNGVLQAYVHSCVLKCMLDRLKPNATKVDEDPKQAAEQEARTWMLDRYPAFAEQLSVCGWSLDKIQLPRPVWTADWSEDKKTA